MKEKIGREDRDNKSKEEIARKNKDKERKGFLKNRGKKNKETLEILIMVKIDLWEEEG